MREKIIQIVSEILECQVEDTNNSLWNYGFESLNAIAIIVEIEKEFNVTIPNELLTIDNWDNINKIEKIIMELV